MIAFISTYERRMTLDRRAFVATAASLAATVMSRSSEALGTPMTTISGADDPLGIRGDFPIVNDRIFLNSAYITPIPKQVVAAGHAFLEEKSRNSFQLGPLLKKCDDVRAQFARLINAASPDEIGLLFSTAEGENVVAAGLDLVQGDNVVIDELHYDTEFVLYRTLEKTKGIQLRIAKHRNGVVDASDIEPLVDRRTRLVSVAWVSHQNGFCHDMRPIADVAHAKGALFYTDAIQAVGSFPIDVQAAGVDFLCAGTYKWLLASFGVAPFYVRASVADRLRLDRFGEMHARELPDHTFEIETKAKRFDYSSRAFGDVYTLSAGLKYLEKVGVARIGAHTCDGLARRLQNGLANQGHRLFTPVGNWSSIVTFYSTKTPAQVRAAFDAAKIEVTVRNGMVRISPALFNTSDDIDRCLHVTRELA
ncbi:MAG: aminotransferase class V-fold PLP-dependent enzyme [Gemmatimonadetes bacterium]|nr:aminotransferase class V-fold PLP-dependent enzyme [Gemmatimonadota bacterium]